MKLLRKTLKHIIFSKVSIWREGFFENRKDSEINKRPNIIPNLISVKILLNKNIVNILVALVMAFEQVLEHVIFYITCHFVIFVGFYAIII
jgi:type IV secretory pathway TrbL component